MLTERHAPQREKEIETMDRQTGRELTERHAPEDKLEAMGELKRNWERMRKQAETEQEEKERQLQVTNRAKISINTRENVY